MCLVILGTTETEGLRDDFFALELIAIREVDEWMTNYSP